MLERGSKTFSCFFDVRKAFDKVIKDLYTDLKAQVLFSGSLSRNRVRVRVEYLPPFMYKVYINILLKELSSHTYGVSINMLSLTSPSFADDTSLITVQPSFVTVLRHMCCCYSLKWKYEFNNTKSGVVTFGETKAIHYESMKTREWILGEDTADEIYEHKNLGVLKNYIGSFSSNVDENIEIMLG